MSKIKAFLAFLATVFVLVFTSRAEATHFRYGNIRYTIPDPVSAPLTVRFEVVTAWRAAFTDSTTLLYGDGTSNSSSQGVLIGSGFDIAGEEYKVFRYTATHTYPGPGQYVASFTSCCRISSLANGNDQTFLVQATVDVTPGNTGNPVTVVPPIVQLQTGGIRTLQIPAVDPDQTPVTCRFATPAETGSTGTAMPPTAPGIGTTPTLTPSSNPPGCTLTWNLTGLTTEPKFTMQVWMESANPLNGNISASVLDFIVETATAPPPTCTGSASFTVDMGQTLNTSFIGTNPGGGNLTMTSIGSVGLLNPISNTTKPSPFTTNFTWSPSLGDDGTGVLAVIYKNAQNLSGFCTLSVTVPDCPQFNMPCSAGVGACESVGKLQCNGANVECTAVAKMPMPEVCNGIDDDCNMVIDDNNPESGTACNTPNPSICKPGVNNCNAGVLECVANIEPGSVAETCNSVDDDCDGTVDDGYNVGATCFVGIGGCSEQGTFVCDGMGGATCSAIPDGPEAEKCDGADNDCDGAIDNGLGLGTLCSVGMGECVANGTAVCDGMGGVKCSAVPLMPQFEVCGDNKDNDCDGAIDNGCGDSDGDGLWDGLETQIGSDPNDADSDDDGLLDGDEVDAQLDTDSDGAINVLDVDSDNDGLFDGTEVGKTCNDPATKAQLGHCRPDADTGLTKTDPLDADSDGDGVRDGSEDPNLNGRVDMAEANPLEPGDKSVTKDFDGDGVGDALETFLGSNSQDADSDDDGHLDGDENNLSDDTDRDGFVNLNDSDSDSDALFDGTEAGKNCSHPSTNPAANRCKKDQDAGATKTSTLLRDTDRGGVSDGSEDANLNGSIDVKELDALDGSDDNTIVDKDGDGLSDGLETTLGTDANDVDSDNDGLLDNEEIDPTVDSDGDSTTNILDADSDNDGLFDGTEAGTACNNPDTDLAAMKCIPDADNGQTKTGVLDPDSDDGTKPDGEEDTNHNGIVDGDETNPLFAGDDIPPPPECTTDAECGNATSGRVCVDLKCADGCRGVDGNGCPGTQICSSTTNAVGTCADAPPPPPPPPVEPEGCSCRLIAANSNEPVGYAFGLSAIALLALRRRRRAA
jgi:MYXO-CTERM domain-containing protein